MLANYDGCNGYLEFDIMCNLSANHVACKLNNVWIYNYSYPKIPMQMIILMIKRKKCAIDQTLMDPFVSKLHQSMDFDTNVIKVFIFESFLFC